MKVIDPNMDSGILTLQLSHQQNPICKLVKFNRIRMGYTDMEKVLLILHDWFHPRDTTYGIKTLVK